MLHVKYLKDKGGYWFGVQANLNTVSCFFSLQVILNVVLNISGVAFAITAIVFYSINISDIYVWWICHEEYWHNGKPSQLPVGEMLAKCEVGAAMIEVSATDTSSTTTRDEVQIRYQSS